MRKSLFIFILLFTGMLSGAQVVFEHTTNHGIYTFLDEMANLKLIELNDVVKPYSRQMISEKLLETREKVSREDKTWHLNKRQRKELDFYLQAYALERNRIPDENEQHDLLNAPEFATALHPPGLFYKDDAFRAGLQIIYGASYGTNENGTLSSTYGGASLFGYIGKNLGFYTSIRDNNMSKKMLAPEYFVQRPGTPYKNYGEEGIDFSEARGGITYSWKWGYVGLVKDHITWGKGYNGTNIQSGRVPSFGMIKLNLKPARWFEFNYYHGWLVSQVVDSSASYWTNGVYRSTYYPKYIAGNMFTFYPFRHFNFSFGNSVVYSDLGGPHAAYLVPFLFYKSVDHTLNATNADGESGQNSQLYFSMSSRNIRHLHLYFTLFMDDLSVRHFSKKDEFNLFSYKLGGRISDFPFGNIGLTGEFTLSNPFLYQHKIETQTYASNLYSMGHYLRDNSQEVYFAVDYKPVRGLNMKISYTLSQHGDDFSYAACALDPGCNLHKVPILENIIWESEAFEFQANYELLSNTYIYLIYRIQQTKGDVEKYTPSFYRGETNTLMGGLNIGF